MKILAVLLALSWLAPFAPLAAQDEPQAEQPAVSPLDERAQDVLLVLRGEGQVETVFSPVFLAAVPPVQFKAIATDMRERYGLPLSVEHVAKLDEQRATVKIRYEHAILSIDLAISADAPNPIAGLLITDVEQINDSAEKLQTELETLPGSVSVILTPLDGGEPLLSIEPQKQLAIGSAFKLYVLSTLARQISNGEHSWDEVVVLSTRSFPSGKMQDWPNDAPVTLHTLATMMISISDNTATDQLLQIVGRESVEAELRASGHASPESNIPFLSTLELFGLKGDLPRGLAYAAASEPEQRRIIAEFAEEIGGNPDNVVPPNFADPTEIDTLEWFASADDLRRILKRIEELDDPTARKIIAVNPVVRPTLERNLAYVGYKGGSEPGVINMTFLLQDSDLEWHVLSMGWNDPEKPVDEALFKGLAERAIALLRR